VVRPTDAQRVALNDLRAVSTKAAEAIASACPRDVPHASTERLSFMEKPMEAMLTAIKTVRPAFEAL
jgi:LTXXQ motif family protein